MSKKILSLDALKELKIKAKDTLKVRGSDKTVRVVVSVSTNAIIAGARETFAALQQALEADGLDHVALIQSGNMHAGGSEPMVEVQVSGQVPVLYGNVTAKLVAEIVTKHIKQGELVQALIIEKS
jgi:NADP-reducing hydrogenase subunit HndB